MGKGGCRGRWRSFQTGYPGVIYSTALDEERARVKLVLQGTDHQRTYGALIRHQAEIDARVDQTAKWHQGDRSSWLGLETEHMEAVRGWGPEEDLETVRERIEENLLRLQDAVQPYLDQVMGAAQDNGQSRAQRAE